MQSVLHLLKSRLIPCLHPTNDIEELREPMALKQRTGNGAALTTGTENSKRVTGIQCLQVLLDIVIGNMHGTFDVPVLPFILVAHIQNV